MPGARTLTEQNTMAYRKLNQTLSHYPFSDQANRTSATELVECRNGPRRYKGRILTSFSCYNSSSCGLVK
jgi:hypothetical protein